MSRVQTECKEFAEENFNLHVEEFIIKCRNHFRSELLTEYSLNYYNQIKEELFAYGSR